MTRLPGCPHCADLERRASHSPDRVGVTSRNPARSGPYCIVCEECPVPVHGETCRRCWKW